MTAPDNAHKLDDLQIESIIDRLVPLIAAPEDYGFFRGILRIKAEETSSGHFAYFVTQLLKQAAETSDMTILPTPTKWCTDVKEFA